MLRCSKQPTGNRKLVSTRSARMFATYREVGPTCPRSCPLIDACYAKQGRVNLHQRGASSLDDGSIYRDWVRTLPQDAMVRLHVSGDIMRPDGSDTPDGPYLDAMAEAAEERPDVVAYGYTHAWRDVPSSINRPNLVINASCDTAEDIEDARAAGWDVVTVVPSTVQWRRRGDVVVCPQQTSGIPCDKCRLCMRPNRRLVVAFKAHGVKRSTLDARLDAGEPSD